jgi:hypothetical protein
LANKTYLPGQEIDEAVFQETPSILKNFLNTGFVKEVVGKKGQVPVTAPENKPVAPAAVEIKTDADLKKVIEKEPEVKTPEVKEEEAGEAGEESEDKDTSKTKIDSTPKKQKGRLSRN